MYLLGSKNMIYFNKISRLGELGMVENFDKIIQNIIGISNESSLTFRNGDYGLGYKKLIEFIDSMQIFLEFLASINTEENDVKPTIQMINSILIQITEAMQSRDSILIADLIDFELTPIITELKP